MRRLHFFVTLEITQCKELWKTWKLQTIGCRRCWSNSKVAVFGVKRTEKTLFCVKLTFSD